MIEMHTSEGISQNYMGSRVHVPFYSIYKDNYLVIRTSDRRLAEQIYNELRGVARDKSKDSIDPAVNTQDDLQAIHTKHKTKTQRS